MDQWRQTWADQAVYSSKPIENRGKLRRWRKKWLRTWLPKGASHETQAHTRHGQKA